MIRHHVEAKTIHLRHCSTNEQIADMFTKALGRENLERFRTCLDSPTSLQIKGGMLTPNHGDWVNSCK